MATQHTPPGFTELKLPAALKETPNTPQGGTLKAVTSGHPHIAFLYGELGAQSKAFVTFRGRGHVESSESVRRKVYDDSPTIERDMDKDRKGVALIIDLDSVEGFFGGSALKMRR